MPIRHMAHTTFDRARSRRVVLHEKLYAIAGVIALGLQTLPAMAPNTFAHAPSDFGGFRAAFAQGFAVVREAVAGGGDTVVGAYGGFTYTHPSVVRIVDPGRTDLTVSGFNWIGMPLKSPVYYGLRVQRWAPVSGFGSMVDFTHAKAIAVAGDTARFEGIRDGRGVAPVAKIGEVFRHLEFSHGHNMLTYNGLFRWPALFGRLRPYVGLGAGIAVPHTEIGFRDKNTRTYEYQFAGFTGQLLGGVELKLGRSSLFFEYKFSYAPYEVPLSEEPTGWLLVTDLWRQIKAWSRNEKPPGGRLSTTLVTHHGIGGIQIYLNSQGAP